VVNIAVQVVPNDEVHSVLATVRTSPTESNVSIEFARRFQESVHHRLRSSGLTITPYPEDFTHYVHLDIRHGSWKANVDSLLPGPTAQRSAMLDPGADENRSSGLPAPLQIGYLSSLLALRVARIILDDVGVGKAAVGATAESLHRVVLQLLTDDRLLNVLAIHYERQAIERERALRLAQEQIATLTQANETLSQSLRQLAAAEAAQSPSALDTAKRWTASIALHLVVPLLVGVAGFAVADSIDRDDERMAMAAEQQVEILRDISNSIWLGNECYRSAHGVDPLPTAD